MIIKGQLLSASNLNNAYISKTDTNPQTINSTLTVSGGAINLKNSTISDNASASYLKISPQGNQLILYDGVHNQAMSIYSSSGAEATYIQTINGSPSIGQIEVTSAIDHLEILTNSKKPIILGGPTTVKKGFLTVGDDTDTNSLAWFKRPSTSANLDIYSDWDGSGASYLGYGVEPSQQIWTIWDKVSDSYLLTVQKSGNVGIGTLNPSYKLDVNGSIHTTGPIVLSTNGNGPGQGIKLDALTIDSVDNTTGAVAIGNLSQLRFGTSTAWDWNQWAGIKYDSTNHNLFIGGPASPQFSSNASPPSIDVSFTGVNNVGVGTDSPRNKLDIQGGGVLIGTNLQTPTSFVDGTISVGDITRSYSGNQNGGWGIGGDTITLHAVDYSTIGFLQANVRVDYIRGGAGNIDIGYDGGFGRADILFANGIWDKNGKVGIGVSPASSRLDVLDSGIRLRVTGDNLELHRAINSQEYPYISFFDSGGARGGYIGWGSAKSYLDFTLENGNNLHINGGNVGIGTAGPVYPLDVSGDIRTTGVFRASSASNSAGIFIGDDSALWDINVSNTMGLYGQEDTAVGAVKLGSTGPTLYGSGGSLGIGTTTPWTSVLLDVAGSIRIGSNQAIYSQYNNGFILKDHGNGNVTVNGAGGSLYLGYVNTTSNKLFAPLVANDTNSNINIVGVDGTLYYKGTDLVSKFAPIGYGLGTTANRLASGSALGSLNSSGWYDIQNPSDGVSGMSWHGVLHSESADTNFATQFAFPMVDNLTNPMYIRTKHGGTWNAWAKVWTTENMGNGSGLDADTVSSYHVNQNLRTTDSATFAGLTLTNTGVAISLTAGNPTIQFPTNGWGGQNFTNGSRHINIINNADIGTSRLIWDIEDNTNWAHQMEIWSNGTIKVLNGNSYVQSPKFTSTIGTGTAPLSVSSTTMVANLNANYINGYAAGNSSGQIPISNGTLNTNLNAQYLNGYSTGYSSGQIPISNGTMCSNLNAQYLNGKQSSDFFPSVGGTISGPVTMSSSLTVNGSTVYVGSNAKISSQGGFLGLVASGDNLYLQTSYGVYCVQPNTTSSLVPCYASTFSTTTSYRKLKTNISETPSVLKDLKQTVVYDYQLIEDVKRFGEDKACFRTGIMIGEATDKITSSVAPDEMKAVDLYSMVSVLWRAVQELNEKIENLEEELKTK